MTGFEHVWQQILQVARTIGEITTLTHKVPNQIVSASENAITVTSERAGYQKIRELRKDDFQCVWAALTRKGKLDVKDILEGCYRVYWRKTGRIIMAFLAHLPNVEYSSEPIQTLYLMPHNTHQLGTTRRTADKLKNYLPKTGAVDYIKFAKYMIAEFAKQVDPQYVKYFGRMGFTRDSLMLPAVLFQFMSIISYDMRPLSYGQVWGPPNHPEYNGNSIRQELEKTGITLANVKWMSEDELRRKLENAFVKVERHGTLRLDRHEPYVDHAKGLKQLASKINDICNMFQNLEHTGEILRLYDFIDEIHGFGLALTAKTILFIVRCFGVGLNRVNPEDLRKVANGLLNEYWVAEGIERLRREGINVEVLMNELTRLGDPFAIEYLYLLETEEDWRRLLQHAKEMN